MTGRERFNILISQGKPDKMPLYIPTVACTVASELLGRQALGGADSLHFAEELAWSYGEEAHREFEEQFIEDTVALHRLLRVDVIRETWRSRGRPDRRLDERTLLFGTLDGPHVIKRFFPDTQSYGVVENTAGARDVEDLTASLQRGLDEEPDYPFSEEKVLAGIASARKIFDKLADADLGLIIPGGGIGIPMTDPAWLEATAYTPDLIRRHLLKGSRYEARRMAFLAGFGFRWFNGGADMASNNGPIYSPASFRQMMVEPLKLFADACRKTGTVFCYRTDGNIWAVFTDMFGTAGVQAFGEADRDATMTVGKIRQANPDVLILGNMSSAFLHTATEGEVRQETRRQLAESGGRNFIAGPSNAIVHGTPVRNIWAMIEEIEKFQP